MLDAFAPTMMFAYAFGRIGCQISGDGDWGIANPTPNPYSWLPDFMWSYTYPHNVLGEGSPIPGCVGPYCNQLAIPVYPTPLYELLICFALFGLLWFLRNKIKVPGQLFSIYLIMNGLERFFIEKIRVNTEYNILFNPTQAELISTGLIIMGIASFIYFKRRKPTI